MGRRYDLEEVLVVEGQDLLTDTLDAGINQIQAVLTPIDVPNDPIVDIDEGVLSLLHTGEHPIEKFDLVHLIGAQVDLGLCKATR